MDGKIEEMLSVNNNSLGRKHIGTSLAAKMNTPEFLGGLEGISANTTLIQLKEIAAEANAFREELQTVGTPGADDEKILMDIIKITQASDLKKLAIGSEVHSFVQGLGITVVGGQPVTANTTVQQLNQAARSKYIETANIETLFKDSRLDFVAPTKKPKLATQVSEARFSFQSICSWLIVGGLQLGISKKEVTPPRTAARAPEPRSSL